MPPTTRKEKRKKKNGSGVCLFVGWFLFTAVKGFCPVAVASDRLSVETSDPPAPEAFDRLRSGSMALVPAIRMLMFLCPV